MAQNEMDPGASTQMFRAFVEQDEPTRRAAKTGGSPARVAVIAVIALVVLAVIAFLAIS